MKKRGQIQSNVVLYAIIGVTVVVVLIFGYTSIANLMETGRETALANFKLNLKNDIANVGDGDVKELSYNLPEGVEGVCFIDRLGASRSGCTGGSGVTIPACPPFTSSNLARNIKDSTEDNVILFTNDVPESFYVDKISLDCCDYRCLEKSGNNVKMRLEGKGDSISVS